MDLKYISDTGSSIKRLFMIETDKVHIFWEGHKFLRNFHRRFVLCSNSQIYGGDFLKFCGLLRMYNFTLELFYFTLFLGHKNVITNVLRLPESGKRKKKSDQCFLERSSKKYKKKCHCGSNNSVKWLWILQRRDNVDGLWAKRFKMRRTQWKMEIVSSVWNNYSICPVSGPLGYVLWCCGSRSREVF